MVKHAKLLIVLLGVVLSSYFVFTKNAYGNHGNDAGALNKCKIGGTCYTKRNGQYSGLAWFYFDFETNGISNEARDTFTFRDLVNNRKPGFPVGNSLMPGVNPNTRMSCKNSRGVYVFGYVLYQKTGRGFRSTGGIMFPQKFSELFNGGVEHQGFMDGLIKTSMAQSNYNGSAYNQFSAEY